MGTLSAELRRQLERTVIEARDVAETGARVAIEALAVHHREPYEHMTLGQSTLRRRLRAHARQIGDRRDTISGSHEIDHLVQECAYEHWHGMLFARFLAENHLLIESETGIAISLEECGELAKEDGLDKWVLAVRFAHHMLPQVFRPDHPALDVQFAREYRLKLEDLVEDLPAEVFKATDSLGWVYQFWQSKKKDEVNRSGVKIGADELPAVTQLFTEPYMVQFLLQNSLGAWWVSQHPDTRCPVDLIYLRGADDGVPAAGALEGWPDDLAEFRLLDPCCGSGHFLVAAFLMLVPMRMALEGLSAPEAVDKVLDDNLHGLELDQRCVAIAAFALALEAWRYPDAGGFRELPKLNLAWCGQPVTGKREQWLSLAQGDRRYEASMVALFETFRDSPILGSLIDPARSISEDLFTAGFRDVEPLLERALQEHSGDEECEEMAIAAHGLARAAELLVRKYHLVITNVPYLGRGKQSGRLRRFSESRYARAKNDLANVFLERCLEFAHARSGVAQIVMPQNWLFLASYKAQREHLLKEARWELLARLGEGGFDSTQAAGAFTILLTLTRVRPHTEHQLHGIDASTPRSATEKASALLGSPVQATTQKAQLEHPNSVVSLEEIEHEALLSEYCKAWQGIVTGDDNRFVVCFWEIQQRANQVWAWLMLPPQSTGHWTGRSKVIRWQQEAGDLHHDSKAHNFPPKGVLGRKGVAIQRMRGLSVTLYGGEIFGDAVAPLIFHRDEFQDLLPAVWVYCSSEGFRTEVRKLTQKVNVTPGTLNKVHFDLAHWKLVAARRFPNGLPKPYSDDPTQWIFHGHSCGSVVWDEGEKRTAPGPLHTNSSVLQVAVARLLSFHWPAENDPEMELADEARTWTEKAKALYPFEDDDGIVCIPSVRGERPAHEQLFQLLQAAWGDDWNDGILAKLLAEAGNSSLDDWLRNPFFGEHCKLFQHRPFIWHIWDGRKHDGFHALVNYHKLVEGDGEGRRLLESLTYSYLGDWIARQQDGVRRGEGGAEDRLAAALELQKRLVAVIKGEPPYDLFVRWKPIEEQPIGWEPDINDGVRLNIRPFMAQDIPGGKKGAGILRAKPNIHWKKDRGKEPARDQTQFPWFWSNGKFTGERVNDIHLTNAEKRSAREASGGERGRPGAAN